MMMETVAEGVTGGIGGLIGRSTAFPFDALKVKMSTGDGTEGAGAVVTRVLREEGVAGLYRGVFFSGFEAMIQKAMYVFLYDAYKKAYASLTQRSNSTVVASLVCGYLSELSCVPVSVPIESMVVQLQSAPVGASRAAIIRAALFTYEGLSAALKSGRAYFVLGLKTALEFAILDRLKLEFLRRQKLAGNVGGQSLSPLTALLLGAIARAVATLFAYPYSRGKALVQAKMAPSAIEALVQTCRKDGALSMYRGLGMELSRGVTQAAVMFAVMERVRAKVRRIILPS